MGARRGWKHLQNLAKMEILQPYLEGSLPSGSVDAWLAEGEKGSRMSILPHGTGWA